MTRTTPNFVHGLGAVVLFLAAAVPLLGPAEVTSMTPSQTLQTRMPGRFVLDEPRDQIEARLASSIERTVEPMSFLIRGIARSRLEGVVTFCQSYLLGLTAEEVTVQCDDRDPIERPLDGAEGQITGQNGEPVQVRVNVSEQSLQLAFGGEEGGRRTTYRFEDSESMIVRVEVVANQLEVPLTWEIRYRRSEL